MLIIQIILLIPHVTKTAKDVIRVFFMNKASIKMREIDPSHVKGAIFTCSLWNVDKGL